jgi:hypothetical protein
MVTREILSELQGWLQQRQIMAGMELLERHRDEFSSVAPGVCFAGLAVGYLARWVDVGFDDRGLLGELLERFPAEACRDLPVSDYVHLCTAKAVFAMRRENLVEAIRYLDLALTVSGQIEDASLTATVNFWKTGRH